MRSKVCKAAPMSPATGVPIKRHETTPILTRKPTGSTANLGFPVRAVRAAASAVKSMRVGNTTVFSSNGETELLLYGKNNVSLSRVNPCESGDGASSTPDVVCCVWSSHTSAKKDNFSPVSTRSAGTPSPLLLLCAFCCINDSNAVGSETFAPAVTLTGDKPAAAVISESANPVAFQFVRRTVIESRNVALKLPGESTKGDARVCRARERTNGFVTKSVPASATSRSHCTDGVAVGDTVLIDVELPVNDDEEDCDGEMEELCDADGVIVREAVGILVTEGDDDRVGEAEGVSLRELDAVRERELELVSVDDVDCVLVCVDKGVKVAVGVDVCNADGVRVRDWDAEGVRVCELEGVSERLADGVLVPDEDAVLVRDCDGVDVTDCDGV